jgi:hypothetical protein
VILEERSSVLGGPVERPRIALSALVVVECEFPDDAGVE